jgi:RNA polymerase sigma factor for flagellar operon FliA
MQGTREEMIVTNLPLVSFVVRKMGIEATGAIDREEAHAYGVEGLIKAVDSFDPERGTAFSSFAIQRIRGSVLDAIRRSDLVPRSLRKSLRELERTSLELATVYGRWPTVRELAMSLGSTVDEVKQLIGHSGSRVLSLDMMMTGDAFEDTPPWEPTDEHEFSDPAAEVDHKALLSLLDGAINILSSRDREIVHMRYRKAMSFAAIGKLLGVSESRVCQLHRNILRRLREQLLTATAVAA